MNGYSEDVPRWKLVAHDHRKRQLALIPSEWRLKQIPPPSDFKNAIPIVGQNLSPTELEITSLSQTLPALQQAIATKKYTAVQVTSAFCHRAALLQQLTNCLTEILFTSALEQAAQQDTHFNSTGQLLGPLHGIPVSIKDNQDIKDVDSTLGWVSLNNKPALSDSPAVTIIRQAAGILYCKTNLPQSMMMSDSYNHLYGQSVNSLNRLLISGGSSGGEAALIAGGGSLVGIGTDIGGSIRIPATLQNLYGLNPSVGRIGNRESTRHQKYLVPPVAGPLARDLDTLQSFMAAYSSMSPWLTDPAILPIPWNTNTVTQYRNKKPLRIGYILDDTVIKPHPPCSRAVTDTVSLLTRNGHTTIDCSFLAQKFHAEAYRLWRTAILADGGSHIRDLMHSHTKSQSQTSSSTNTKTDLSEPLIPGMLVGQPTDALTIPQREALSDEITSFKSRYLAAFTSLNIDALIMPVTQWAGLRPKEWVGRDMYVGYTSIWNLMDWTSLCVPTGVVVDRMLDASGEVEKGWREYQGKWRSKSDQLNWEGWDVDLFEGMPVGVQVVTGRLQEEKAVGIAWVLEELRKKEGRSE